MDEKERLRILAKGLKLISFKRMLDEVFKKIREEGKINGNSSRKDHI